MAMDSQGAQRTDSISCSSYKHRQICVMNHLDALCYILAKCIAIFARNLIQTIMETIDFIDEIKTSVITNDALRFHQILQKIKKIDCFEGALTLAQGFDASNSRSYSRFVYLALCENPEWGTIMREGYGQPLFRQFFRSGACECMSRYLNDMSQAIKEILPRMIEDAKTWHQESLRQLECLPDKLPFRCLRGELTDIYVIVEKDYDDIMPIIRYQDIGVRQNLMLLEMGAYID